MKKVRTAALVLLTMLSLTAVAHADVIAGPAVTVFYAVRLLPWILVGGLVGVTAFLLQKFWKKKK